MTRSIVLLSRCARMPWRGSKHFAPLPSLSAMPLSRAVRICLRVAASLTTVLPKIFQPWKPSVPFTPSTAGSSERSSNCSAFSKIALTSADSLLSFFSAVGAPSVVKNSANAARTALRNHVMERSPFTCGSSGMGLPAASFSNSSLPPTKDSGAGGHLEVAGEGYGRKKAGHVSDKQPRPDDEHQAAQDHRQHARRSLRSLPSAALLLQERVNECGCRAFAKSLV